jgi:hypothetical protein
MKSSIQIAVISIIAIVLGMTGLIYGLERSERYECKKLEAQAKQFSGFYMTDWQIEMCQRYK